MYHSIKYILQFNILIFQAYEFLPPLLPLLCHQPQYFLNNSLKINILLLLSRYVPSNSYQRLHFKVTPLVSILQILTMILQFIDQILLLLNQLRHLHHQMTAASWFLPHHRIKIITTRLYTVDQTAQLLVLNSNQLIQLLNYLFLPFLNLEHLLPKILILNPHKGRKLILFSRLYSLILLGIFLINRPFPLTLKRFHTVSPNKIRLPYG